MKRREWLAGMVGAAVCAGGPLPAWAQATRQWHFEVWLGDTKVGQHDFDLSGAGPLRKLRSLADLDVKLMGLSIYRYHHESIEQWDGNCLQSIASQTRENKREMSVRGQRQGDGFEVSNRDGDTHVSGCVMSYAYWNPHLLTQTQLLNPQNGKLLPAVVSDKGKEAVVARGQSVPAQKYELSTKGSPIELWYAEGGTEWVALASTIGGQRLRYRLV